MNKIYRIVFNTVTGRWVVASEIAKGRKKAGSVAVAVAVVVLGTLGVSGAAMADGGGLVVCDNTTDYGRTMGAGSDGSGIQSTCNQASAVLDISFMLGNHTDASGQPLAGVTQTANIFGTSDGKLFLTGTSGIYLNGPIDLMGGRMSGLGRAWCRPPALRPSTAPSCSTATWQSRKRSAPRSMPAATWSRRATS